MRDGPNGRSCCVGLQLFRQQLPTSVFHGVPLAHAGLVRVGTRLWAGVHAGMWAGVRG